MIESLGFSIGGNSKKPRQQLSTTPVRLQRLAVISKLLVAEHQTPIQTLIQRVDLDARSIQVYRIFPTTHALALARRIAKSTMSLKLSGKLNIEIGGQPTEVKLDQTQDTNVETLDKDPTAKP